MHRLVALTLVVSLGSSSAASAGESLMQSASRIIKAAAREQSASSKPAAVEGQTVSNAPAAWVGRTNVPTAAVLQGGQPVVSKSGLRRRTKVLIYLAAGVGLAATAWAIDHHVVDVTPSSLGTRRD